jgi:hypothetical protein
MTRKRRCFGATADCSDWKPCPSMKTFPSILGTGLWRNRKDALLGTDCVRRKCIVGNTTYQYTICEVPKRKPRLYIHADGKLLGALTVPSVQWGKNHVDEMTK